MLATEYKDIRDRITQRMDELGLNATRCAKKMNKSQSTLQSFMTGRTRTFRDMVALAEALETTTEWLLTGKGSSESKESCYDTPEFTLILSTAMLMWAEKYKDRVSAERVQQIAKQVCREMNEESDTAKKSSIKLLLDADAST